MPVPGCWETRCAWDPVVLHGPAKHSISVSDGLTHPGISPFIPTGAVGIGAMHPRQSRVGGVRERLPTVGSQAPAFGRRNRRPIPGALSTTFSSRWSRRGHGTEELPSLRLSDLLGLGHEYPIG